MNARSMKVIYKACRKHDHRRNGTPGFMTVLVPAQYLKKISRIFKNLIFLKKQIV